MYPDYLIKIGEKGFVTLYGVFIAVGVILCMLLLRFLSKKLGVDKKLLDFTETTGYIAVLAGFLGGTLFQDFYNFLNRGYWTFFSGITFLGGLITGAATFLIIYIIKRKTLPARFVDIAPVIPPCLMVAHGFGRIGCNFAGCCYGYDIDVAITKGIWPKWLSFMGVDMSRANGPSFSNLIPTQLMEAAFLFIFAGILILLLLRKKAYNSFSFYLLGYGIWRFFIEFLRDDARGKFIGNITPSQFWSLVMVACSVPAYIFIRKMSIKYGSLDLFKGPNCTLQ